MNIVQTPLQMTDLAKDLINSGLGYRDGGVVRRNDGKIFEFLTDATKESNQELNNSTVVSQVPNNPLSSGKKVAIGTLVVGTIALAGFGIYKLAGLIKNKSKTNSKREIVGYNSDVTEYLNGMYQGTLKLKDVKNVISFFEMYGMSDDSNIEISLEELNVIIIITKRYLNKLCENNNLVIDSNLLIDSKLTTKKEALDEIMVLLKTEKDIFENN